jgi:hypothetical protein
MCVQTHTVLYIVHNSDLWIPISQVVYALCVQLFGFTIRTVSKSYTLQLDVNIQAFQLHAHLYTLYFFSLFWGHVFFAFHNLGTFCHGELLKLV